MITSVLFRRVGAYVLDCALLFVVLAPLGMVVQRLLGVAPNTAQEIYATLLLNFSIPAWVYFTWADGSNMGATLGKRWCGLQVTNTNDQRISTGRALGRTALKMIPWETTHAASFLFVAELGTFELLNWIGLGLTYVLVIVYLTVAWRTQGEQSVHDLALGTKVIRVESFVSNI